MQSGEGHIVDVLNWWYTKFNTSALFEHVVVGLLDLSTVGSMTVERAAKPLKNFVWSKSRNRLRGTNAAMLLRVGMNIRLIFNIHKDAKDAAWNVMGKTITEVHVKALENKKP